MQARKKNKTTFFTIFLLFTLSFNVSFLNGKTHVLFSPDDNPQKHLINHIKAAKNRIYVAIYMFTDKTIAEALVEKKKEKLDIQIIADPTSIESEWGKVKNLAKKKIQTFIFNPEQKKTFFKNTSLMHNKFAIIDNNVWTGSFNWTISANTRNQENVIWTTNKTVCQRYLDQFEKLKLRCTKFKVPRKNKILQTKRQTPIKNIIVHQQNNLPQILHTKIIQKGPIAIG